MGLLFLHVLIYPYWNVNFYVGYIDPLTAERFNLSILECKCVRGFPFRSLRAGF